MSEPDRPLGAIRQILVPVSDVDRAADFYERVLGLPLLFRYPGNAFFDAAGVSPVLRLNGRRKNVGSS